ncbi:thiaminase II [Actinokineospora cianjurensis]|uniref:Aminopyrimidine aminohydrolase n=1 Tax=Actinokineospora cianjurensis TaxID=585224 RepID=A0A421B560_9PSEU|nr:thiaminase II [Actinokineospora cianjurensis]RLK59517.1 thiaminase /4-amino-5-aminomethyl-2-methylpyrimidine deaminase [Actinokineospora cianjurensis]
MTDGNQFKAALWSDIEHIYRAILAHPFITGLADGTLPRPAFQHFITQDAHYLRDYARVLTLCATKAAHDDDVAMFASHSAGAVAAEQELHAWLLAELGTTAEDAADVPVMPTTLAYTSYLMASAYRGSYAEAVGAVLPCYWLYARVGTHLRAAGSPDPLYARWIEAYADPSFQDVTNEVLTAAARVAWESSAGVEILMRQRSLGAARYEYLFWDAAWRLEEWPV